MWVSFLQSFKLRTAALRQRAPQIIRRRIALLYRRLNLVRYGAQRQAVLHGFKIVTVLLVLLIVASGAVLSSFQLLLESYFTPERFSLLRGLLATIGGALVGAAAIGFSIILLAVQLNFARMPHGLFRKLSSDLQLLSAFAATFFLAIAIAAASLAPDASWSAVALVASVWSSVLILFLFFYGYRRALDLINPNIQLRYVLAAAQKDLRGWSRGALRMAPLLDISNEDELEGSPPSKHDIPRVLYFQANPHWKAVSRRSIAYAVSFARRYAEQGDYEVSRRAFSVITNINAHYVKAKGKTFFANNPIFDIPQATDAFINDTLEHLRQLAQLATTRGDEEQIRQVFAGFGGLIRIYATIDYASTYADTKEHAQLAAGYLSGAVEAVLRHNMPDVVMEGVRLMGISAQNFLVVGDVNGIVSLVDKIAAISCAGALKQNFRPITLIGMEQLSRLTFDLIRAGGRDIRFAVNQMRGAVELVAQMFLNTRDAPIGSAHSNYLAPYFSFSKKDTLGDWLTQLANEVIAAEKDNERASTIVRNVEQWAEDQYQTAKKLLLLAIDKKSHFTFDIIHWIAHITKALIALSKAPTASEFTKEKLERDAIRLISVLSWVPDNKEAVGFVETFGMTDVLFEAALDALSRETLKEAERTRELLIEWAFKGGRYETGWGILEKSLLGLAAVVLWKDDLVFAPWFKSELIKRLAASESPNQELRDRAARELRREAATLRRREFEFSPIQNALNQIDAAAVRALLTEIADILSPHTVGERVNLGYF